MALEGQVALLIAVAALVSVTSGSPLYYSSEKGLGKFQAYVNKLKIQAESSRPATEWSSRQTWQRLICVACKVMTEAVQFALNIGVAEDRIEDIIIGLCDWLDLYDRHVCDGIVRTFKDELHYIISHLDRSPDKLCGVLIGPDCAGTYWPLPPWNVTLPDVPKPPVVPHILPEFGSPTLRVLHLTDIHLDDQYTPGTNADCPEPLCCRSCDGKPKPGKEGAGRYGDYRYCDTPSWTLEGLFSNLSQQQLLCRPMFQFDYILWTGDLPAHNVWNQSREDQLGLLYSLTDLMNQYFPDTPIVPAVGNHESFPVNSFPPRYVTGPQSIGWLYDALANAWKSWLPSDALQSIRKGGYYTIRPYPGFRIVSLNTNVCHEWNWWLFLNTTDPDGQLAWLIDTLHMAENNKEKVHIIGHIPPGIKNCLKYWSYNYYLIVDRYESTITGQFFGHTHFDHFEVFYDAATLTRPTNVAYISPSVTPYSHLNMGYRVFTLDGNYSASSWAVLDHETYILNLTAANSQQQPPVWELEYTAKAALGMGSLFPEDWELLIARAEEDNALVQKLYRFYYKSNTNAPCDRLCGQVLLCAMRSARSYSTADFCPHLSPSHFADHPIFAEMC